MSSELGAEPESNSTFKGDFSLDMGEGIEDSQTECTNARIEDEELSEQVFSIPLILSNILEYLDKEDLLTTSVLNQNWNFFSREVLREKKECSAIIGGSNPCHDLKKLNAILLNSEVVPFNGISIDVPTRDDPYHECLVCADLSESINNILEKINLRYLTLYDGGHRSCISFRCFRSIIQEKGNSLEELRLDIPVWLPHTFSKFIGLNLQGQWLPKLQILAVPNLERKIPEGILKELVEAAPNLQAIDGQISVDNLEFILPLKAARVVKEFDFSPTINSLANCAAFCQQNPHLDTLCFSTTNVGATSFSEWSEIRKNEVSRILKHLLKSNQEWLRNAVFDHFDLILMTSKWKIPVLKNVTRLTIMYDSRIDDSEGYSTLRKVDWVKYFPSLEEVSVGWTERGNLENDFYIDEVFRQSDQQFVCESVKTFWWMWSEDSSDPERIQMFKKIFPNVNCICLKGCGEFNTVINELWTAWPDLEHLHASINVGEIIPNYDSLFLGVSEEESAYLLENVEDLEFLEIVSTKPCIFNLPKLKSFSILVHHDEDVCPKIHLSSDAVFLSRLTGQCVFARMPWLEVEIGRVLCEPKQNCHFAINHLKPFVNRVD